MSDQAKKYSRSGVKTVEIKTVRIARDLASTKNNPPSERAEFARKFVEESISRSSALFPQKPHAKAS
ncbi:hypothetical protein GFK90_23555 [Roseibium aggregatum]|nr:hypothetical protein GFK90_23555 [Roseibium aggregatum]